MAASIEVVNGDVLTTACDVLILKHAKGFFGADLAVADALDLRSSWVELGPGKHILVPTGGKLLCKSVLFYGVGELWDFGYSGIREFAAQAMNALATTDVERESIAMTMHGVGYGLDEQEAFTAQVAGLLEHLNSVASPDGPRRIMIVEREAKRFQR